MNSYTIRELELIQFCKDSWCKTPQFGVLSVQIYTANNEFLTQVASLGALKNAYNILIYIYIYNLCIFFRGCREAHSQCKYVNVKISKKSWVYKAAMLGKEILEKPWLLFTWAVFQKIIWIFKACKIWEYPVGNGDQKHGTTGWYIQYFYLNQKKPNLEVANGKHRQQVLDTRHILHISCKHDKLQLGSEIFIENRTTANLRKLDVSQ